MHTHIQVLRWRTVVLLNVRLSALQLARVCVIIVEVTLALVPCGNAVTSCEVRLLLLILVYVLAIGSTGGHLGV